MNDFIKKTLKLMYFEFIIVILILTCCTLIILNCNFDLFAIIFLISEAYILTDFIRRMIKNKRVIKNISSNDKVMYENELSTYLYKTKENYIFTENFIFFFDSSNIEICKYEDVLMIYKKMYLGFKMGPQESYYILTKKGNLFKVLLWSLDGDKNNENLDLEKLFIEKNSNILIGKTKENKKIIKEKYKLKV